MGTTLLSGCSKFVSFLSRLSFLCIEWEENCHQWRLCRWRGKEDRKSQRWKGSWEEDFLEKRTGSNTCDYGRTEREIEWSRLITRLDFRVSALLHSLVCVSVISLSVCWCCLTAWVFSPLNNDGGPRTVNVVCRVLGVPLSPNTRSLSSSGHLVIRLIKFSLSCHESLCLWEWVLCVSYSQTSLHLVFLPTRIFSPLLGTFNFPWISCEKEVQILVLVLVVSPQFRVPCSLLSCVAFLCFLSSWKRIFLFSSSLYWHNMREERKPS